MKKRFLVTGIVMAALGMQAAPARADVNVYVNVNGPRPAAYHPITNSGYYYNMASLPNMLFVPQLGFYVAVGQPYDLLFLDNYYYVSHGGQWYRARHFHGPWKFVKYRHLPRPFRVHKWKQIRTYCDREYRKSKARRWLKHRPAVRREIRDRDYYDDRPRNQRRSVSVKEINVYHAPPRTRDDVLKAKRKTLFDRDAKSPKQRWSGKERLPANDNRFVKRDEYSPKRPDKDWKNKKENRIMKTGTTDGNPAVS
ncbi:hypothetical protein [Prosthecochloris sp. GSB1]|uniref:hypothetical protein n=1 Tax=Prosthecochloris sp. GSB1 TaxID=281093 RepID=UPI0012373EC9|nr:hypothetical protein [Prosthecochloris sp. GSB1]